MNPFAALRARTLLTGGLVITLLIGIPAAGRGDATVLLAFVVYPLLFAWAVFLARRNGVSLRRLAGGPPPPDQTIAILALVPALVALDVGSIWLVYTPVSWVSPDSVRGWLERMEKLTPSDLAGTKKLLFVAGAVLLAPAVEELIFRGLLLHRWALKWGRVRGLVATSVAFALLHPSPVNAFILGFGFGLIYLSTGSLWLTIAAHSLNNLIALELLPRLGPDGGSGGDTLMAFREATGQALVMFAGGAIILWLGRRWYWPDLRQAMPYDRALPDSLGSEYRVPRSEDAGSQAQRPLPPMEPGTRHPELEMEDEMATNHEVAGNHEIATLAGGCFWCLEAAFAQLRGVERVTSGYTGGQLANPSYEAVCTGTTGHAEVVQVTFNPAEITFRDLLEVFFTIHDPTTLNRQGVDVGTQYRSVIFYHSPEQRATAEQVIAEYDAEELWGAPLVTEVLPLEKFYPAEGYHNDYFARNPYQPYCLGVVAPKVAKVRSKYAARLKQVK